MVKRQGRVLRFTNRPAANAQLGWLGQLCRKTDAAAAARASGQTPGRTGQLHGLEALARQSATRGTQRVWRVEPSRQ